MISILECQLQPGAATHAARMILESSAFRDTLAEALANIITSKWPGT
jgi:hypothetical protein